MINAGSSSRTQAIEVGSTERTVTGTLSRPSQSAFYQFDLAETQNLRLRFRSAGGTATVQLGHDRNRNQRLEAGELVRPATLRGRNHSVTLNNLERGTYIVRVARSGQKSTQYRLSLGTPPVSASTFIEDVVQLTNRFRSQHNLSALTLDSQLSQAAYTHSRNMALQDFFDHTGRDGSLPWDRMKNAGYDWARASENIAAGFNTPAEVVKAWIESPGHRANLLDPDMEEMGVGYFFLKDDTGSVNYNTYWTQTFGTPQ